MDGPQQGTHPELETQRQQQGPGTSWRAYGSAGVLGREGVIWRAGIVDTDPIILPSELFMGLRKSESEEALLSLGSNGTPMMYNRRLQLSSPSWLLYLGDKA